MNMESSCRGDVEKYYDATAERTAREWYSNDILLPTQRDVMTLLPPRSSILDFGCGPGYEARRLHSLGAEVTGVDISAESVRIASSRNPDCRFMKMDFFAIDDSVGRFNAVWASGAFIHVPPETMDRVLLSIRNLLFEQGLLAVILRDGSGSVVSHPVVDGASIERIVYRYTQREFTEYCRAAGLAFLRDGVLDTSLREAGWRCYFFIRE